MAASGQRRPDAAGQQLASNGALLVLPSLGKAIPVPPAIVRIVDAWPDLPPHVREAILILLDVATERR